MSGVPARSNFKTKAAWIILAALALLSFGWDWNLVSRTGSIDFRNRVTGARLLIAGEDAYHYKWLPGAPAGWCDIYANRAHPVTKTTVTPAMLLLTSPVAALPYPAAQRLWLILEWACLVGIWWVWLGQFPVGRKRLLWTAVITGFSYTLAWRHHIDRGQYYILLALLISLWMTWSQPRGPGRSAFAGALAGLLIAFRPPLLLLLAPFLWFRRPEQRQSAAVALAVAVILPLLLNGESWGQYTKAMGEWSHLYRHNHNPAPGALAYPEVIEGFPLNHLANYAIRQYADSSLFRLLRACGVAPVPAPLLLAALAIALAFWARTNYQADEGLLLTGIAAWSFLIDYFLPAYRNPYNDVLILNVIACLLLKSPIPRLAIPLLGLALVLGCLLPLIEPGALWVIHLPTLALTSLALLGIWPARAK